MYICIVPGFEPAVTEKPIYVIPAGQMMTLHFTDVDFSDTIFFIGSTNLFFNPQQNAFQGEDGQLIQKAIDSPSLAINCNLLYSSLMLRTLPNAPAFSEAPDRQRPKLSQFVLKKNKARIGKVRAKNGMVFITQSGQANLPGMDFQWNLDQPTVFSKDPATSITQDIDAYIADGTRPLWRIRRIL